MSNNENEEMLYIIEEKSIVTTSYQVVATSYEEALQQIKDGDETGNIEDREVIEFKLIDTDRW